MRLQFACLLACLLAGAAAAQNTNDPQIQGGRSSRQEEEEKRNWKEGAVRLPAYPKAEGLIEFTVSVGATFRFFIDPASLSVGDDRVVRYTLIARSPSGVTNVSYEGIRCSTGSYKIFARGNNGQWSPQESDWRVIEPRTIQRWHNELRWQYFCPMRGTILSTQEGLDALRRGGHPGAAPRSGF